MSLAPESLHIGMKVVHPRYGVGVVKALTEHTADIVFDDAPRTISPGSSDLTSAEAMATLSDLQMPLTSLIRETASAVVEALGLEKKEAVVEGLANRWQRGSLILQSGQALSGNQGLNLTQKLLLRELQLFHLSFHCFRHRRQ